MVESTLFHEAKTSQFKWSITTYSTINTTADYFEEFIKVVKAILFQQRYAEIQFVNTFVFHE